jgi:4-hydroxybenzoate polyprenyltransferase
LIRAIELRAFFLHLRWHYQLLILPAGYILGGVFQRDLDLPRFLLQFANVHLLLNGGVTAYNSYWDKDEGPIGGLEHPPPMQRWMLFAALALQLLGLALALPLGATYAAIYATTMLLSIAYSHPTPRWKGRPLLSLVAVGIGTGTNTFLLGYLAAGEKPLEPHIVLGALGVASMLLAFYPISQLYQLEADQKHGDRTFAATFGLATVKKFYVAAFILGAGLLTAALTQRCTTITTIFAITTTLGGAALAYLILRLRGEAGEYKPIMRVKYLASLMFTIFATVALIALHS